MERDDLLDRTPADGPARSRAGRPTRERAEQRHEELLDSALEVFLDRGFELATIDAIAASVGMTKRTLYARYEDKAALFKAAVQRAIERFTVPIEALRRDESGDLEETLKTIARRRIGHVMSPVGVRLQRIMGAESYRFPEMYNSAFEQGTLPMIAFLVEVLRRHMETGELDIDDPYRAATAFLSMVVGGPTRLAIAGAIITPDEMEERIRYTVRLFLRGALTRQNAG